ncbi:hypothetical protein ACFYRN_45240 [Streptomyces sp. NPDC005227]|uniref:hypothetical protein n=1 Tax=Streptomyces sp. NPDC005227 TaxID=3364707 RepID=UPI00369300C6
MTGRQQVNDALFVDCGDGYEIKQGDRAGQIVYRRQPRARFECVRCEYASEIVTGPVAVREFVANEPTSHRAVCPAIHNTSTQQGAIAA